MDRTLAIRTPESITFFYELAGIGSRFLAVALDMLIQTAVTIAIILALVLSISRVTVKPSAAPPSPHWIQSLAIAIIIAMVFTLYFGYFIIWEAAWNGQTPGKRLVGIRVVRDGGFPIDFTSSLVRNLVRVIEFGLGFYFSSIVCALLSPENKRIGDLAAGTIVVRDSRAMLPGKIPDVATRDDAVQMTDQERLLIARFLERRRTLDRARRAQLAAQIAAQFRARVPQAWMSLPDEALLEQLDR